MGGSLETVPTRRERRLRLLANVALGLVVAGYALRAVLNVLNGSERSDLETGTALDTLLLIFPVVGFLLARKRPRNPLGWLLLAIGAAFVASPGPAYARYATVTRDTELPGAGLALALDSPMWVVFVGVSGFVLLLFPDGHLPSPRWRWFARTCAAGLTALFVSILLSPDQGVDYDLPRVENPIAIEALRDAGWILTLVAFVPLIVVGGAVALIRRRRRTTDPVQRLQLRWVTWAAAVGAAAYVVAIVPSAVFGLDPDAEVPSLLGSIAVLSFLLIPISIAIAILRYRLYDIDFVIRKTVVVAVLVTFIALVYAAIVVGVGALVGSGPGDPVLSAIAAAIVALAFQPLRSRARRLADRVVYGRAGDALRGPRRVRRPARRHVLRRRRASADRSRPRRRCRCRARDGVAEGRRRASCGRAMAERRERRARRRVRHGGQHRGEVLGALSVTLPPNEPLDPTKEQLVRHLADQAGLVLSNVRLTEELRARLDDLRAAQKRLVTAQDAERKRLERNIHDGAQQQLVALAVKLRLAEQLTVRDPDKARDALVQLQADTDADARGAARPRPRHLSAAARRPRSRRRPLRAGATCDVPDRRRGLPRSSVPAEVEAAVYFSCLEALQNVAKYAEATRATVRVDDGDGDAIAFEVADDGHGFDPSQHGLRHRSAGHRRSARRARRDARGRQRAGSRNRRSAGSCPSARISRPSRRRSHERERGRSPEAHRRRGRGRRDRRGGDDHVGARSPTARRGVLLDPAAPVPDRRVVRAAPATGRAHRLVAGGMGVGLAFFGPFGAYGAFAIERDLPFAAQALAIGGPGWVPFIAISGYLLLLFPDGRLPTPRWRWISWACGIGLTIVVLGIWVYPGDFADAGYPDVENPFGVEGLAGFLDVFGFLLLSAPLLIVTGFVALVVRLRRTTDDVVRHQIRWLAYAAAVMATLFAISFIPGAGNEEWDSWIQNLAVLLFMAIPLIIGIAILRYRLYDIDVVIRKTVVSRPCSRRSSRSRTSASWSASERSSVAAMRSTARS